MQGPGRTLLDVVCTLEHHDKYKLYRSRVAWILDEMEKYFADEVKKRRVDPDRTSASHISAEEAPQRRVRRPSCNR